jgi:hypothetical protein
MHQHSGTLTTSETSPTQHAMVIHWGHFARTIGLLERLPEETPCMIPEGAALRRCRVWIANPRRRTKREGRARQRAPARSSRVAMFAVLATS